jgi:hypothetical protein
MLSGLCRPELGVLAPEDSSDENMMNLRNQKKKVLSGDKV